MSEDREGPGELCGELLLEGQVIQVVQDRHPTYDRELVLSTFHRRCWEGLESQSVTCSHCGCSFRLVLGQKGRQYQNLSKTLLCPFCGTEFDSRMGR